MRKKEERLPKVKIKTRKNYKLLLYLFPFMVYIIMFRYVSLFGWSLAFMDYLPGVPFLKQEWVGFANFKIIFEDLPTIGRVYKNTVIFALIGYLTSPIPMLFAIALNEVKNAKISKMIQTITTFPNFISWVIVFALCFQFFSYDGLLSNLLIRLGLREEQTSLLANGNTIRTFLTCVSVWKGTGWGAIVYLAAISGIDQEMYDAASIDGAGRMQKIWYITIPSLLPTYFVLMLMSIGSFAGGGMERELMFYNGVTAENIEVLDLYVYRMGLMRGEYSMATAVGIMKSALSIFLLFVMNYISKRTRGYNVF